MNSFLVHSTSFCFHNNDNEVNTKNRWDGTLPHYTLFDETMRELGQLGFFTEKDKDVDQLIRKDYRYGRYHELEFKAHRYPAGFKIEFYQNINYKNPNGGYYDSDKYEKMPYLQKLIFKNITNKLKNFMSAKGYEDRTKIESKTSVDTIKADYVESWHKKHNSMDFDLSDLDGTTVEKYNNTDRDGKTICNGDIKYFRNHKGYLVRGRVYHRINNMWWVILNKHECTVEASFYLFDLKETDIFGRMARNDPPKEYIERKTKIAEASTKELMNELRRRGMRYE